MLKMLIEGSGIFRLSNIPSLSSFFGDLSPSTDNPAGTLGTRQSSSPMPGCHHDYVS